MRIFTLDENYSAVCNFEKTRNGFRHVASLHKNGISIASAKTCYLNRTWECYEFESVLYKLVENNFDGDLKAKFMDVVKKTR